MRRYINLLLRKSRKSTRSKFIATWMCIPIVIFPGYYTDTTVDTNLDGIYLYYNQEKETSINSPEVIVEQIEEITESVVEFPWDRYNIPSWVICGILKVETRSFYNKDGTITYVDRRRGTSGERGAFQIMRIAFDQVSRSGERYSRVESDPYFASEIACRYLLWLHKNFGRGNWNRTVSMYNTGPRSTVSSTGQSYARKVYQMGTREVMSLSQ